MAGAEGFEPPLAVLETAGLPLNLRPYFLDRMSRLRVCGCQRLLKNIVPYRAAYWQKWLRLHPVHRAYARLKQWNQLFVGLDRRYDLLPVLIAHFPARIICSEVDIL